MQSLADFEWYKRKLDADAKYEHRHTGGNPAKYPCRVMSRYYDDPNGPYTFAHDFMYQQEIECACCGHKTTIWPKQAHAD